MDRRDPGRHRYDAVKVITNLGGIRADPTCPLVDNTDEFYTADPMANAITHSQVAVVPPFVNVAVTVDMNVAELEALLEAGLVDSPHESGGFQEFFGPYLTYNVDLVPGTASPARCARPGTPAAPVKRSTSV